MKDGAGRVLYIGKAANLRRRAASYFSRANDARIEKLVSQVAKIDYKKTASALEALILESRLIKKYQPPFNIKEKDDKSFLYAAISKEKFPRVLLVRGKGGFGGQVFGPFVSAFDIRETLRILRKIFPWSVHPAEKSETFKRPCFEYEIGLCPGTCVGAINRKNYMKGIRRLKLFLQGKKAQVIKDIEREMRTASKNLEFERAAKLRGKIFALNHVRDTALISATEPLINSSESATNYRIEGYDISNTSGTSAVGSMVVFIGKDPDKNRYRKFRIRTIKKSDDIGMLKEVISRRLGRRDWQLPDLILVDGGRGQVNAARFVLDNFGLKMPVVGIAKGPKRKKNEFIGSIPAWADKRTLIRVRNEAHRFAVGYHRLVRGKKFIEQ